MYNPRTQKPRGFGFVTFAEEQASELVLSMEHHIDNKKVSIYIYLNITVLADTANTEVAIEFFRLARSICDNKWIASIFSR